MSNPWAKRNMNKRNDMNHWFRLYMSSSDLDFVDYISDTSSYHENHQDKYRLLLQQFVHAANKWSTKLRHCCLLCEGQWWKKTFLCHDVVRSRVMLCFGVFCWRPDLPISIRDTSLARDTHVHDDIIKWKHIPRHWPFVRGIHWSPTDSPHKGQWSRAFDVLFDLCLNKLLSKYSKHWLFETPSRSLWRHCNVITQCQSNNPWEFGRTPAAHAQKRTQLVHQLRRIDNIECSTGLVWLMHHVWLVDGLRILR